MSRHIYFAGKNHFEIKPSNNNPDKKSTVLSMLTPFPADIETDTCVPRKILQYTNLYEHCGWSRVLRGQSIQQIACNNDCAFMLTTERSQVYYMGDALRQEKELKQLLHSTLQSDDDDDIGMENNRENKEKQEKQKETTTTSSLLTMGQLTHLPGLDHCKISLLGTGRQTTFFYSALWSELYFTGMNMLTGGAAVPSLTRVELPIELRSKEIVKMNGSEGSMFFLTRDGCLYALGKNSTPRDKITRVMTPKEALVEYRDGMYGEAEQKSQTRLDNGGGSGGGGENENNRTVYVVDVQSGHDHTLILYNTGQVFGIGSSGYGQLAQEGSSELMMRPCKIPGRVKWIRACSYHSFFGTFDGQIYACGYNSDHRLVINNTQYTISKPTPIDFQFGEVKHLFGYVSTMIVNDRNEIYVTGANDGGDCGLEVSDSIVRTTTLLSRPPDLIHAVASGDFDIDVSSGVYFRFVILKPNSVTAHRFARNLLSIQRSARLADTMIYTQEE